MTKEITKAINVCPHLKPEEVLVATESEPWLHIPTYPPGFISQGSDLTRSSSLPLSAQVPAAEELQQAPQ